MRLLGIFLVSTGLLVSSYANAAERNDSPHSQECMAKSGFTLDMWRAHRAGTDAQVHKFIQCRDRVSAAEALRIGRRDHNYSPNFYRPSRQQAGTPCRSNEVGALDLAL